MQVLDDATTGYCSTMDGRILKKEELNAEGWPPAHHNCRSMVVPIVEGEEFTYDKIPKSVERGEGFSRSEKQGVAYDHDDNWEYDRLYGD